MVPPWPASESSSRSARVPRGRLEVDERLRQRGIRLGGGACGSRALRLRHDDRRAIEAPAANAERPAEIGVAISDGRPQPRSTTLARAPRECLLDLRDDRRLGRDQPCRRLVARRRLGNRPSLRFRIAIDGKADAPVLALIELVAGAEMHVGVLPRELEAERRLCGRVRGDRLADVGPLESARRRARSGARSARPRVVVVESRGRRRPASARDGDPIAAATRSSLRDLRPRPRPARRRLQQRSEGCRVGRRCGAGRRRFSMSATRRSSMRPRHERRGPLPRRRERHQRRRELPAYPPGLGRDRCAPPRPPP